MAGLANSNKIVCCVRDNPSVIQQIARVSGWILSEINTAQHAENRLSALRTCSKMFIHYNGIYRPIVFLAMLVYNKLKDLAELFVLLFTDNVIIVQFSMYF